MSTWKTQEFFEYDDGTVMTHEMLHDVFDQTIKNNVLYVTSDNHRHRTSFTLRHYYGRELRRCLKRTGMNVLDVFGNIEGAKLTNRDIRMLVLAEKTPER